jgi:hypothetical protein
MSNIASPPRPKQGRRFRFKIPHKQWAWQSIEMLTSPAWCALSLSGRRVLDRLEIELARHGGEANGQLPVTYDDFVKYGIHRHSVALAIREVEALGFAKITRKGRAGNAEWRRPHLFEMLYKHTRGVSGIPVDPSDDWRKIRTREDAERLADVARKPVRKPATGNRTPVPESAPSLGPKTITKKRQFLGPKTVTTAMAKTITTVYSLGRVAGGCEAGSFHNVVPLRRSAAVDQVRLTVHRRP